MNIISKLRKIFLVLHYLASATFIFISIYYFAADIKEAPTELLSLALYIMIAIYFAILIITLVLDRLDK